MSPNHSAFRSLGKVSGASICAWTPPIRYVQDVMGMDLLLYAMDYPYQFVPEEVNVTDELKISYEDHKAFYQTNAERVFKLGA